MSKNKYESLANAPKPKEPEIPESTSPQPAAEPGLGVYPPTPKTVKITLLLWFLVPVTMVTLSILLKDGCR